MIAIARACLLVAVLTLVAACDVTDVVARRAHAGCTGAACAPGEDAGQDGGGPDGDVADDSGPDDSGPDDSGPDDSGPGDSGADGGVCAAATCQDSITCAAPVPRAIVGDGCGAQPWVAPAFQYALCACDDFVSLFPLTVERAAGGMEGAASVAVDGYLTAGARIGVAGGLFVGGTLDLVEQGSVDADEAQAETGVARCDCGADVVLSADAVRALAPSNPVGFDPSVFDNIATDETVPLDCGAYRVPRIAGPSGLNLTITGHVVLIVEGDVELDSNLEATLGEGALLELFVLGNLRVAGALVLGDEDDDVRVYVLGRGTVNLNAEAFIAGPLYAPNAELVTRSGLTTMGSIFVRRAAPGGAVTIRYDSAAANAIACQ